MGKRYASSRKLLAFTATAAIVVPVVSPIGVSAENSSFKDVPARYAEAVAYLTGKGITEGLTASQFGTDVSISRVDAAIQLAISLGIDPNGTYKNAGFTDVPKRGQWAVNALAEKGIVAGKKAGTFGAPAPITRNETARLLALAYNLNIDESVTKTPFTDVNSKWAKYVDALIQSGVTKGKTSSRFGADDHLKRGEWALFLHRLSEKPAKTFDLTVMHDNDTHAHIENIARKVTAIKEVRSAKPHALLLDAGDVFSGTLYFNEYLGQADLEFMNLLRYDAMTFGNHEFDLGTKPLANFIAKAKFPFVSANVNFTSDENIKGFVKDEISALPDNGKVYDGIIKEVDGEKVGIFGLTTAETADISSPGAGVVFEDYLERSKETVAAFEKQGVNKIIALTHIGFKDGGGDNDVTLAKEVEGIDVIVGGHSHDLLKEPVLDTTGKEPTVIVQANEYNKYLGTLDVTFDENGKVIGHAGKLIEIDAKQEDGTYVLKDDAEAASILAKYKPAIEEKKKTIVGKTTVALNGERADARTKETNLGNLITDSMLEKAKTINKDTVIAVQNGGGIRASIDEGDITLGEVLTVMPFGNSLAIMNLTGAEIRAALEHSVKEAPGQSGGFLQVSGLKFTYDSSKPVGERVQSVEVKKAEGYVSLADNESYVVATNTFTAKGGDGYEMFGKAYGEGRVSEPGFVDWEMFRDYLQVHPNIAPELENRITNINQ